MLLENITCPTDLKKLSLEELKQVNKEIKEYITKIINTNGGHLGSAICVSELTIALHFVFNSPDDKIIWDIGHQSYVHKILTGRFKEFQTIRKKNGLSGFCKITESKHDIFGAGHSSTSIPALAGLLYSQNNQNNNLVAIIGDSSLASGMALEGLNIIEPENHGNTIIIINDNDTSISPSIGNIRNHLTTLRNKGYTKVKDNSKENENIFTLLGYNYVGVIDGHDINKLIKELLRLKTTKQSRATIVHVKTDKKGHSVSPSNKISYGNKYTHFSTKSLEELMQIDSEVVAVSAAMTIGTGLEPLKEKFPERIFDVGISEQAAVTFCGAMTLGGKKPFLAIYSTFLQRGYDQVIHDIALQNLPVRFLIDRAGFVGEDGSTHDGSFDIAFLRVIPNIKIMSPRSGIELARMIKTSFLINDSPSAIRYSKYGNAGDMPENFKSIMPLEIGCGEFLNQGKDICLIGIGHIVNHLVEIQARLKNDCGINPTIFDAKFIKPLDTKSIQQIANNHKIIFSFEDGSIGGLGSALLEYLSSINYDGMVSCTTRPDKFINHATTNELLKESMLDAEGILETIKSVIKNKH